MTPLLPDLTENPCSLFAGAHALRHSGPATPLAAAMLRAGLAPTSSHPHAPWAPGTPRFAHPAALAAAVAGAPALLPPADRLYATVAAHAIAARLATHPGAIHHIAWCLFPTPLASPTFPDADLQLARFEARTITPEVARAVVLSSRSTWISFEEIARSLASMSPGSKPTSRRTSRSAPQNPLRSPPFHGPPLCLPHGDRIIKAWAVYSGHLRSRSF